MTNESIPSKYPGANIFKRSRSRKRISVVLIRHSFMFSTDKQYS